MIGQSAILKLAKANKPLHCVTVDYGVDFAKYVSPELLAAGFERYSVSHYATKAQAFTEITAGIENFPDFPRKYSTRPVTPEEVKAAQENFFYVLI